MKELIMKAFTDYLGMALEDMDEIGKNLYSPDYEIFEAGWLACQHSNGVANNGFNRTREIKDLGTIEFNDGMDD